MEHRHHDVVLGNHDADVHAMLELDIVISVRFDCRTPPEMKSGLTLAGPIGAAVPQGMDNGLDADPTLLHPHAGVVGQDKI